MKKKISRIILIILVLIIIFCIRNLIIIRKAEKALYEFRMNPNHYFYRNYGTTDNSIEVFYKDGKVRVTTKSEDPENPKLYWSQYGADDSNTQIMIIEENKQFVVTEGPIGVGLHGNIPYNYTFIEVDPHYSKEYTWYQKLLGNIIYSLCPVIPTEYNGVKCYEISYNMFFIKLAKIYIDRDTYLPIASKDILNIDNPAETYKCEVDIVTDEDVTMPDISEYSQSIQGEN